MRTWSTIVNRSTPFFEDQGFLGRFLSPLPRAQKLREGRPNQSADTNSQPPS